MGKIRKAAVVAIMVSMIFTGCKTAESGASITHTSYSDNAETEIIQYEQNKKDVEIIQTEKEDTTERKEKDVSQNGVDRKKIEAAEYDDLQMLFISLPTDITPELLENILAGSDFAFSTTVNHGARQKNDGTDYIEYTIEKNEDKTLGAYSAYIGKGSNTKEVYDSAVVVVFSYGSKDLEYILYLNYYGPYNGHGEALYYNTGKFGDINKILWDNYTVEDIGGKYYHYEGGVEYSTDPAILNVTFRDGEDVPYYYRGKEIQTGFRVCEDAKEAVYYTLRKEE